MYLEKNNHHYVKVQRGFLIPLALFIIIAMGGLALVVSRTSIQTQNSSVLEVINLQTFYAAESGAQRAMQALFFPDASVRKTVDSRCAALNQSYNFASINGLSNCTAQVACLCRYSDNSVCAPGTAANYLSTSNSAVTISFYTVTSIGSCGTNPFRAERTIQAGAFLKQE